MYRRYGLEAASLHYFNMPARQMSLGHAAMLAGLLQRPEALSPLRHPERALERRNHVLRRMVDVGFLTEEAMESQLTIDLDLPKSEDLQAIAPYFVEDVRRWLQERYGSQNLYTGGLTVRTTLDPRLQELAAASLKRGLARIEERVPALVEGPPSKRLQGCLVALRPQTGEVLALVDVVLAPVNVVLTLVVAVVTILLISLLPLSLFRSLGR